MNVILNVYVTRKKLLTECTIQTSTHKMAESIKVSLIKWSSVHLHTK